MIFHEIKVHYDRQTGEDNPGKVKEVYLIDGAVSFADAENCLMEEIKPFIFGDRTKEVRTGIKHVSK